MSRALLIPVGIPITYPVLSTGVLITRHPRLLQLVQRLTSRDALVWSTLVGLTMGITMALTANRWMLSL